MTGPVISFSGGGLVPLYDGARTDAISLQGGTVYVQGQCMGLVPGSGTAANEVQRITITGTPTGGTFSLFYGGQYIGAIARNATAAVVAAAVNAWAGATIVTGSGGPLPGTAVDLTYTGEAAGMSHALLTAVAAFTGGTTPAIAVTRVTAGMGAGGYWKNYDDTQSDGSNIFKRVLQYPAATDIRGWVVPGDSIGIMASGVTPNRGAPAYYCGIFRVSDLVGLDAAAIADPGMRLINGNAITDGNAQLLMSGGG